jgi:hypothetical protein
MGFRPPGHKSKTMTPPAYVRLSSVVAPALLLLYGVLRYFDGRDGHHDHDGALWRIGHTAFFVSFALLAVLLVGVRPLVAGATPRQRSLTAAAAAAVLLGTAAFLWTALGDLFSSVPSLPDSLQLVGPLLFEIGALILLVRLVLTHPRRLPAWAPVAVFAGFLAIGLDLDLLPLGALAIGAGLIPLSIAGRVRIA